MSPATVGRPPASPAVVKRTRKLTDDAPALAEEVVKKKAKKDAPAPRALSPANPTATAPVHSACTPDNKAHGRQVLDEMASSWQPNIGG